MGIIKSMPQSLTCSIAKDTAHRVIEEVLYRKSNVRKVLEIVKKVTIGIFLTLAAIPVDLVYVPGALIAKQIYKHKSQSQEKGKIFYVETFGKWHGNKDETETGVRLSNDLMVHPEKFPNLKRIKIPIANCKHLNMTEEDFPKLIDLVNECSLDIPYAVSDITSRYFGFMFKGTYVCRFNHNGTHSARQLRFTEGFLELVKVKGTEQNRKIVESLTEEERLNLNLAGYFCRAGRVDESNWNDAYPDRIYKIRSAQIYEAYARQLYGIEEGQPSNEMIEWTKQLIIDSSTYDPNNFSDMDEKTKICRDILQLAHKVEQIRCAGKKLFDSEEVEFIQRFLQNLLGVDENTARNVYLPKLLDFAKQVSDATGVARKYDKVMFNKKLFIECSKSGSGCLKKVRAVEIPNFDN